MSRKRESASGRGEEWDQNDAANRIARPTAGLSASVSNTGIWVDISGEFYGVG